MTRYEEMSNTAQQDRAGQVLWAIIDGQAIPGSHWRAVRLLGSRAVARQALTERASLDSRLRAWASPELLSAERADLPTHSPLLARLIHAPLQRIVAPSAALGAGLFLVALRFRLDGLYEAISTLVERWRGL